MRVLSVIHHTEFSGPTNRNIKISPLLHQMGVDLQVLVPARPVGSAYLSLTQNRVPVLQTTFHRLRDSKNIGVHLRFAANFFPDIQRIRKIIRDHHIDIVQLNGLMNPHSAIAARLEGKKVIWQLIDTQAPKPLMYMIMPMVALLSDAVMSTGRKTARFHPFIRHVADRLYYFHPPVDTEIFTFDPAVKKKARAALGLAADDLVVGTVSTLNPAKGHRYFIDAAAEVVKDFPETRFVVLGSVLETRKDYAEGLRRHAAEIGFSVGSNFIFKNPEFDVHFWAHAFDVFWMTSLPRSEGIPTAVEEAMSLGIPVVAFDVGSLSEIVNHGKTGYVVPVFDVAALARHTTHLIAYPDLRVKMGAESKHWAHLHFSAEQCARSHLKCYRSVIGKPERKKRSI